MVNIPIELKPAYERPVDRASIDERMADQLAFENGSRTIPVSGSGLEASDQSKPNAKGDKLKKAAALGAMVIAGVASVHVTGRAIDHEIDIRQPAVEHNDSAKR